jgi:transcriptional regulator with PAS, ATPase and Fis domain
MSNKVLFLVPPDTMDNEQVQNYSSLYPEVDFEFSNAYDPISQVQQKLAEGVEIVAARGYTAENIRQRFPKVHVVKIQVTGYDIIRSLGQANLSGATVAVITNKVDLSGLSIFEDLYSIRIIGYLQIPLIKLEDAIRDAVLRGAHYILSGVFARRVANEMGCPAKAIPLVLGPESVSAAIHEIKQIQEAIEIEAERQEFLSQLLDSIDEGIISVDSKERITLVNANAARMLQTPVNMAIGRTISYYFPETIPEGENILISINKNSMLVTRTPLIHGNQELGAIYTLHEPSHIKSLETHIRRDAYIRNNYVARFNFKNIIGERAAMKEATRLSKNYAITDANVLITGETGSGKEMFAQSIHNASKRRKNAFVAVNCAALPETLLESELFGYVEGAFTGATRKGKAGLFEVAHGGTIFLDEISEMSYSSQGRLLRVLQEKYIVRLGSHQIIPVDVRVIAATNRNLQEWVQQGKFREDLYYRLNVLNVAIPPLREREGDASILLKYFLKNAGLDISLSEDAVAFLNSYQWRGNVREVCNLAERIAATATGSVITRNQIEILLDPQSLSARTAHDANDTSVPLQPNELKLKKEIIEAIRQANNHMGKAAAILGIDRSTLWRRMKKFNLK